MRTALTAWTAARRSVDRWATAPARWLTTVMDDQDDVWAFEVVSPGEVASAGAVAP